MSGREKKIERERERKREILETTPIQKRRISLRRSANQLEENKDLFYDAARISNPIEIR